MLICYLYLLCRGFPYHFVYSYAEAFSCDFSLLSYKKRPQNRYIQHHDTRRHGNHFSFNYFLRCHSIQPQMFLSYKETFLSFFLPSSFTGFPKCSLLPGNCSTTSSLIQSKFTFSWQTKARCHLKFLQISLSDAWSFLYTL